MHKTIQYSLIFVALVVLISTATVQDTSAEIKVHDLYSGGVSVDFSPDGRYIATGDTDGRVGLWEVSSGENIYYRSLGGSVRAVAFSPNGKYLAADGYDGNVRAILLEASSGAVVASRYINDEAGNINSIAYSPDGKYVAVGLDLRWAYLWELSSNRISGWGFTDASEVYDVAFSPDAKSLATGNNDGLASLWELSSWWTDDVNVQSMQPGDNVRAVAFSPNGRYLAADGYDGRNNNVTIYDVIDGRRVQQIDPDINNLNALVFSPDGQYLAVGGEDPRINIYRIDTEQITLLKAITREVVIQVSGEVHDLAWDPSGDLISDGRAVYRTLLRSANIVLESQEIDDGFKGLFGWGEGNTNNVVEVGEQIAFIVTLRNKGTVEAKNVKGTLSTEDRIIGNIIVDGEVDYGNIGTGDISPIHPVGRPINEDIPQIFKFKIPAILTTRDATFTLTVTADNGGPWTFPITVPIINPTNIGIAFPENLISEEAFSTHTTYFILKIKHPTLTGIPDAETHYQDCEITLHIPKGTQAFMFPIRTRGERAEDLVKDVLIYIGDKFLPGSAELLTLLEFFARFLDLLENESDLKIAFPNSFHFNPGRPDTEIEYVVLLKNELQTLKSLDITIEQTYRRGNAREDYTVRDTATWNFDDGWASPAAHPVVLADYPPFQKLPLEVQQYLLFQFSEFATAEAWRIPGKTVMEQNYPNPFNPETWIPYRLANPADVQLTIYDTKGALVHQLDLGHQMAGYYTNRSRAAYWDGRNGGGESVASGTYFYQLRAGDYTQTRRMIVVK